MKNSNFEIGNSKSRRILGLDVGDKRIGVAVGEAAGWMAKGLCTVERVGRARDLEAIATLAREHEIGEIVVGLPLLLDGSVGEQARRARRFGRELAKRTGLPIVFWDERLSTVAAGKLLREAGVRGVPRERKIDAAAAELILQSYLDYNRTKGNKGNEGNKGNKG